MKIPGVIDVMRVQSASAIAAVARDQRLGRVQTRRGPVLNRLIARMASTMLTTYGHRLPSGRGFADPMRHDLRADLIEKLTRPGLADDLAAPVATAATYVKGEGSGDAMALAQGLLAPVFGLEPTKTMADDARKMGAVLNGGLLRQLRDWLTTGSQTARDRLYNACNQDLNAVHALGIASQNLAASLKILRETTPATPRDKAMALALTAPRQVLRQGHGPAETIAGSARDGTLVVLMTEEAARRTLDPDIAFLTEAWSGCPAHRFVPDLLDRIWTEAGGAS